MFAFLKRLYQRLFVPSEQARNLAFEHAQKEWQATEGAGWQRRMARYLTDLVRAALRDYFSQNPLMSRSMKEVEEDMARIVQTCTMHWRRYNMHRCPDLRKEEFHLRAELDFPANSAWFAPRVVIHESGSFRRLSQGRAMIEVHDKSAPRYQLGISDWQRHREACAIYAAELNTRPSGQKEPHDLKRHLDTH